MVDLRNLKPREVRANLEDYVTLIYSIPKGGKSSLFYNLTKEMFSGDLSKGIYASFEEGTNALQGAFAQTIETWQDFQEMVEQLVSEKEDLPFEWVAVDTVGEAYKQACQYIVKRESLKDKKRYVTVGDIPFGKGYELVSDEISNQISRLQKAKYGLFLIGHEKDKKYETKDGTSFDKTVLRLPDRAREIFVNMADFILYIDIEKVREGDVLVDKRYIHFRNPYIECGSRFKNVPDKIEYDPKLFLETFERAVLTEYSNDETKVEKVKEEQKQEREEQAKEYIEKEKNVLPASDSIAYLDELIPKLKKTDRAKLKDNFEAILGDFNYRNSDDAEGLQKCAEIVKGMLEQG